MVFRICLQWRSVGISERVLVFILCDNSSSALSWVSIDSHGRPSEDLGSCRRASRVREMAGSDTFFVEGRGSKLNVSDKSNGI